MANVCTSSLTHSLLTYDKQQDILTMRGINSRTIAGAVFISYVIAWFTWSRRPSLTGDELSRVRSAVDEDSLSSIRSATLGVCPLFLVIGMEGED